MDGTSIARQLYGMSPEFMALRRDHPVEAGARFGDAAARCWSGRIVHIADVQADPDYTFAEAPQPGRFRDRPRVPLLREGKTDRRLRSDALEVRPFTRQADRARADLRRPGRDRDRECPPVRRSAGAHARELTQSLEDLRTAQDRLVQTEKLASLGQLTAGIAHEIKNPLNFVNNFASLSGELLDELQETLDGTRSATTPCAPRSTN